MLTDRVTRLLLDRVKPERILCLTFTKAAAAEMRNRLAGQLGRWAMMTDAKLDEEIEKLIDRTPEAVERVVARRLFARVLDAPGGINILTIHAFCQALLKRFPLEAGVAPGFEVLDEADARTLLRHAQDEQMEALARPDAPGELAEALASVAGRISVTEYAELMTQLLGERAWLLARIGDEAGLRRLREQLARELGCAPDDTAGQLTSGACLDQAFDAAALRAAARALARGSKTDVSRAALIAEWLADAAGPAAAARPAYREVFFTDKGAILETAGEQGRDRGHARHRGRAAQVRPSVWPRCSTASTARPWSSARWPCCGSASTSPGATPAPSSGRAALDYDDLIVATRRLLESADSAAWVLYKLDGGIDHVLVDEAQDTNPDQWEVIRRLTEEFFVGQGAVERTRTVFAVGDIKQSIFGFQRADPRKLKEMREWFAERSRMADKRFVPVDLNVSFRSTPAVLDAVDWVFSEAEARARPRRTERRDPPAQPQERARPRRSCGHWSAPTKTETDTTELEGAAGAAAEPHQRLARLIAAHAGSLIGKERRAGARASCCTPATSWCWSAGATSSSMRWSRSSSRPASRSRVSTASTSARNSPCRTCWPWRASCCCRRTISTSPAS